MKTETKAPCVGSGAMVRDWLASNRAPKPGKIHLHCRTCGRFKKNVPRSETEPSAAALLMTECDKCNRGDFSLEDYVDSRGQDVVPWRASPNTELRNGDGIAATKPDNQPKK